MENNDYNTTQKPLLTLDFRKLDVLDNPFDSISNAEKFIAECCGVDNFSEVKNDLPLYTTITISTGNKLVDVYWNGSSWLEKNPTPSIDSIPIGSSTSSKDLGLQKTLIPGNGIQINGNVISCNFQGGTTDYNELSNKPKINGVELTGNMTAEQLGIGSRDVEIIDNLETQYEGKALSARQGKVLKDLVDTNGGRIENVMDEIGGINAVLNQINPDEATTNPVSINQLYYVFRKLKEVVRALSNTAFTNGKPNISDWQIPNISEGDIGGDVGIYYDIARHLTNAIMGNTNNSIEAGESFVSSFSFSGDYGKFGWFVRILLGEDDVTADSVNYGSKTIMVENVGDDIDVTINGGVQAKHTANAAKGTNFTNVGTSDSPDYRIGGNNQLGGHIFAVKEDGDFDLTSIINDATMNSTTRSLLGGLTFFKIPEWAERIVAECSITGTGASGIRWSVYGFRQSEDGRSLYRNLANYNNERTKIVERSAFDGYNLMFFQFRRDADTNWYTSGDGIVPEEFSKVGITFRFE